MSELNGNGFAETPSEEEEDALIHLLDEAGEVHTMELIEVLDVDGVAYAAVFPVVEADGNSLLTEDDDITLIFLRIEENDEGEETLIELTDEAEFDKVVQVWNDFVETLERMDADGELEADEEIN